MDKNKKTVISDWLKLKNGRGISFRATSLCFWILSLKTPIYNFCILKIAPLYSRLNKT